MFESPDNPPEFVSSCWLLRSRRSPAKARQALLRLLGSTPAGELFADSGLLVVSELVTNAVVHGTPIGNRLWLSLSLIPSRLRIEVHDARRDRAPLLRPASAEDESGRGLLLVKLLSERWGCCPRVPIGKIVWSEIGSAAASSAPVERVA
ncbi:ATP-binding protein [Kitasatospora sp. NPDC059812]|uniref:ATP-binding protein n=1 Tax=Kitasatospora sp. NPDC059812 TaxID=3346958 RepID=UPI003646A495